MALRVRCSQPLPGSWQLYGRAVSLSSGQGRRRSPRSRWSARILACRRRLAESGRDVSPYTRVCGARPRGGRSTPGRRCAHPPDTQHRRSGSCRPRNLPPARLSRCCWFVCAEVLTAGERRRSVRVASDACLGSVVSKTGLCEQRGAGGVTYCSHRRELLTPARPTASLGC
jgi:hypothetical protein